jgi:hypothetical protein
VLLNAGGSYVVTIVLNGNNIIWYHCGVISKRAGITPIGGSTDK